MTAYLKHNTIDVSNIEIDRSIKDGGHKLVRCSNCEAPLNDIWHTRPDDNFDWKVISKCPHCGDSSFIIEVHGNFHIGDGYLPNPVSPDDREQDIIYTVQESIDWDDKLVYINNKVVKKWEHK